MTDLKLSAVVMYSGEHDEERARLNGVCAIAVSLRESFNSYGRYEILLPNGEMPWRRVSQL